MSTMRIFGMASGMDIDQMVKDMMKAERVRVDKVAQDKQILKWRQELYNTLNKDFANFILDTRKEFELSKTTSTGALTNNSLSSLSWVKKASSSDETIATVSSTASAVSGNYNVSVKRLADGVSIASGTEIMNKGATNLADQFSIDPTNGKIQFTINTNLGSKTFAFGNGVGPGDDNTITIDKSLGEISLKDIVSKINSAKVKDASGKEVSLGITASYDAAIGRFFLRTNDTGSNNTVSITDNSTNFIDKLNLKVNYYQADGTKVDNAAFTSGTTYNGVDSLIDFAGATDIKQSSNQFTINGLYFDLKKTGDITVKVDTNIDGVYDKISKFVEKYNELVDKFNSKLTEKQYRSFRPLTEEQKEAMSEKEIELWEEKAKSGLLRNDMILSNTMQSSRNWMYEEVQGVTGVFNHLTEIGITTEKYVSGSAGGKLAINETKLKEAIRDNADGVLELLFKESTSVSSSRDESTLSKDELQTKRKESGIITRLYDNMIAGMKEVIGKAGTGDDSSLYRNVKSNLLIDFVTKHGSISLLDKDITKIDKKLDDLTDYLVRTEDRYYSKFSAMEKAIQQMNSQSSWLAQQLG